MATITNTKARAKQLIIVPNIVATMAIIDPLLIRLQPKNIAAWTGFDAMAHGFEAFVTKVQGPYAYGILLRAIQLVSENLRDFAYNRMNNKACERMCWAATMGGIAIGFGAGASRIDGRMFEQPHGLRLSPIPNCRRNTLHFRNGVQVRNRRLRHAPQNV